MGSKVILAYSGGLDTSFCIPWLKEKGHEVITVFVDTGGVPAAEREALGARAKALGAVEHIVEDGADAVFEQIVVPLVMGGQLYQDQYPLLVSDRYVIVERALAIAAKHGTRTVAHGCTGMGNDQVRFDLAVRAKGDYEILAPVREIQDDHPRVREFERAYLEERGHPIPAKQVRYTVNENLLGATLSGSEIDEWEAPGDETHLWCAPASKWPKERLRIKLRFERGVPVALDGEPMAGAGILRALNERLGAYGVGRGIYTGDTTVGLKGRIVFEAPGITGLLVAHRALEETILTSQQNGMKPLVARKWVELVYKGFFFEPLKDDLEAFIKSSQRFVTGEVTLETEGGAVLAVAVDSPHVLRAKDATYAQVAGWTAREAEGFIRLLGQSAELSAKVNPRSDGA
jgi:argininosuccinate synthase